jgi:hypothetical protein
VTRDDARRFVKRGRARLEAMRLARAAARGALVGAGVGLVALGARKLAGFGPAHLPWALLATGTIVFLAAALGAARIGLPAAALWLDRELGTQERLTTLIAARPGPFDERLQREVGAQRLPRLPFPREIGFVPGALFLLFAAGLLPAVAGAAPVSTVASPSAAAPSIEGAGAAAAPDVDAEVARLARGEAPGEAAKVRAAIDAGLHRPEDRAAAHDALEKALSGDAAAGRELAGRLGSLLGGAGESDRTTATEPRSPARPDNGGVTATPYTNRIVLVRAYRRALLEKDE